MNWNHRLMNCPSDNGGDDFFVFKEVFYDDQDRPDGYSNPFMGGDSIDEVQELLARLQKALTQPVLHENDFKGD
jgi:hypothetical protein